jgi:hypothetical protein
MENILQVTRGIHAVLGAVCLLSGIVALTAKKRQGRHGRAGKVFAVSLVLVYVTILLNIAVQRNIFMLTIGWLAVHAGIEGWRALKRFKGDLPIQAQAVDHGLFLITSVVACGAIAFGLRGFIVNDLTMGLVCAGFGCLGLGLARDTWRRRRTPPHQREWLIVHIDLMTGAFSAALIAFLVLQFTGQVGGLEWLLWVGPVLAMWWYAGYEKKRRALSTRA